MVLVDLDRRVPLGFAPSRKQADVGEVLEGWGETVLSQISEVSIDLCGNYKGLVHKLMPQASSCRRSIPCDETGQSGFRCRA